MADGGDAERLGDDGDVALAAAVLDDEAAQPRAVVVQQVGGTHGAGHQHRVVRQLGRDHAVAGAAGQDAQQAVGQFVEVAQPLVPVGVGLAQHARAGVVLHALDRRLGRHAALDRLVHATQPAAIVREHAIGFQHLAMLAGGRHLALLQHLVDGGLQLLDGGFQAAVLLLGVLGLELGDHDARLVQHHVAERQALRQRLAAHDMADRATELGAGVDAGDRTRDQMLGQHHGGGLQHLDVLVGVFLVGLVLDGQHTQHIAVAQHRHGQEGMIDLLARLGAVGEGRMVLRVRLVDGHGQLGAAADQTFAALHEGVVHGARIEAFGGEQLERAVLALQVDGAHLGHHQTGDLAHDLVEPGLTVRRLGHDLPEAAHDDAERRLRGIDPRCISASVRHQRLIASRRTLHRSWPNPRRHPVGAAILADHYGLSVPGPGRESMKSVFAKLV